MQRPIDTYSTPASSTWQPFKFSGKESLARVGLDLYDFGARMYSPSNMRGLTMDPLISELEASIKRIKESGLWTPSE